MGVNTVIAILEPRILGRGAGGLSALIVLLSLVFWGWVLGPIGAVLSVPLTTIAKIALESHEDSRWVATMLGPSAPAERQTIPHTARAVAPLYFGHKGDDFVRALDTAIEDRRQEVTRRW